MKKIVSILMPVFASLSLVMTGYGIWYFGNANTVTNQKINHVITDVISNDLGVISLSNEDSVSLMLEPDRLSFNNNLKVTFTPSSNIKNLFKTSSLEFALSIRITGDNSDLIGNAIHIESNSKFVYEHLPEKSYSSFEGFWHKNLAVNDINGPIDFYFSSLKLSYSASVTTNNFSSLKKACDGSLINHVFSVETIDTNS